MWYLLQFDLSVFRPGIHGEHCIRDKGYWTLGKRFFRRVYAVFDMQLVRIEFARARQVFDQEFHIIKVAPVMYKLYIDLLFGAEVFLRF